MAKRNQPSGPKKRCDEKPRPTPEDVAGASTLRRTDPSDLIAELVEMKREMTRHLRALDAVGIDPTRHPGLDDRLGALGESNGLLVFCLHLCTREAMNPTDRDQSEIRIFVQGVRTAIAEALEVLPDPLAEEVREQAVDAGASEREVWLEVAQFREAVQFNETVQSSAMARANELGGSDSGSSDAEETVLGAIDEGPPPPEEDLRVARLEAEELPATEVGLDGWLTTLPKAWLVWMAWMYDVERHDTKPKLVRALSEAMLDPYALSDVIEEALGPLERELLAIVGAAGDYPREELADSSGETFEIPFGGWHGLPPGHGAKLRALGLVYVGQRDGASIVTVPEDLVAMLPEALRNADPMGWRDLPENLRDALEEAAEDSGHWLAAAGEAEEAQDPGDEDLDDEDPDDEGDVERVAPRLRLLPPAPKGPLKVYELEVVIQDSAPPIRRKLRVAGDRTLAELHYVLQTAFGWENDHLHRFQAGDGSWSYTDPRFPLEDTEDEREVTLQSLAPRKGSRFFYVYDFGDEWVHNIKVTERIDPKKAGAEPRCVDGTLAGPPEDSGGVWGYAEKLEVLADPEHEDHNWITEWMGEDFDATRFDLDAANDRLARHFDR